MFVKFFDWLIAILAGIFPASWFGPRKWFVLNGVPVNYDYEDRPSFWFPNAAPGANYLLTETRGPIKGQAVSIAYTVQASGNAVFDYRTAENNMAGPGDYGIARLFIQRKGDDYSAEGDKQFYRFWALAGYRKLENGSYVISASLDPARWSSVYGNRGDVAPEQFAATLRDAEYIGVTFGGGLFFGHGCFCRNGSAMFRVDSISY
jgi:hypothetical protein